jgi:hypothetical protein
MNQRQQERVADLGRALQEAFTDIINIGEDDPVVNRYADQEPIMAEPEPMTGYAAEAYRGLNHDLAPHMISITQVHNGFIVEVGCQRFAFETYDKMSKYMKMYYEDPHGMYEKHSSGKLFGN